MFEAIIDDVMKTKKGRETMVALSKLGYSFAFERAVQKGKGKNRECVYERQEREICVHTCAHTSLRSFKSGFCIFRGEVQHGCGDLSGIFVITK